MVGRVGLAAVVLCVVFVGGASATEKSPTYELVVEGDLVSLQVSDGPVVEIVQDLGRKLDFEVVLSSVGDQRVSDRFEKLPARDAVRRICASVGYLEVPDPKTGKIARLVLTGSSGREANRLAPRRDPLPRRPVPQVEPATPRPPQRAVSDPSVPDEQKEEESSDEKED